jgi:hypothetical protein
MAIAEALEKRDPANTQWQVDEAVSCAKLGSLDCLLLIQDHQEYLSRGLNLLTTLKQAGRMPIRIGQVGLIARCVYQRTARKIPCSASAALQDLLPQLE